jgi:hypothetical protein
MRYSFQKKFAAFKRNNGNQALLIQYVDSCFLTKLNQEWHGNFFVTHCTENPIYIFPEMEHRGLIPNSYIHVSVSNLYVPKVGLPIWLRS